MESSLVKLLPGLKPERPAADPFRTFTEEKRRLVVYHISRGESRETACELARVSYKTFGAVIEIGSMHLEDHENYGCPMTAQAQFVLDVKYAAGRAKMDYRQRLRDFADVQKGGDPRNWAAEFTFKERTEAETYGRKSTVSVQQETAVKVILEERGGNAWQQIRAVDDGDVVDTAMIEETAEDA